MVLSASLSAGRIAAKPIVEAVQQNSIIEAKPLSMSNVNPKPTKEGFKSDSTKKDDPKPVKKKRHIFIKVALGSIVGLYVVAAIVFGMSDSHFM